jgi:AcrR family transcriptional regulator
VPRPRLHHDDDSLDAARALFLTGGSTAVTTTAISEACGAPVGSLYHRFGSRQELLTELWLRTVRRFQQGLLDAVAGAEPGVPRALAAAGWVIDFVRERPDDARLLMQCRREELVGAPTLTEAQANALDTVNEPILGLVRQLAREVYGSADAAAVEGIHLAVADLPYAAVRRHLRSGSEPDRARLLAAVAAVLDGGVR